MRRLSCLIDPVAVPDLLNYRVALPVNIELHPVRAGAHPKMSREVSPKGLAPLISAIVQPLKEIRDAGLNPQRQVLKLLLPSGMIRATAIGDKFLRKKLTQKSIR